MMNKKRSNLHTAWKYFFLLPVFAFLACLLNEPVAYGQDGQKAGKTEKSIKNHGMETEGYWFAIIKDDKVNIRFSDEKMDDDEFDLKSGHSFNATTLNYLNWELFLKELQVHSTSPVKRARWK